MAYIISSGVTSSGIILVNNSMTVLDGGIADETLVSSGGRMYISNGGMANYTTVNSGQMYVSSGGRVNDTMICSDGSMSLSSGGTANSTLVNSLSFFGVHKGGFAKDTTVNGGLFYISTGGMANNITVHSGGTFRIYSQGQANNITISSGCSMFILSGGTALDIQWTPCVGYISISDGAVVSFTSKYSGVYYGSGDQLLSHEKTMDGKVVDSNYEMHIMSGGTANNTTVFGRRLEVFSGGTANNTTVSSGVLSVSSGGIANNTIIFSRGSLTVLSGGVANNATIHAYGSIVVSSGGTAMDLVWTPCIGSVSFNDGAVVSFDSAYSGVYYGAHNQLLSHEESMDKQDVSNASMYVMSGGTVNNTTVKYGGHLYVSSGGMANNTTVNSQSYSYISNGGTANNTFVESGGYLAVFSGGTANSTIIRNDGRADVYSGGTANNILVFRTGIITLYSGGVLDSTILSNSDIEYYPDICGCIISGGIANNTKVDTWCSMFISSGGTANNTTVNIGQMFVSNGGYASGIKLYGREDRAEGDVYVSYGGFVENAMVEAYGDFYVASGGTAECATINALGRLEVSSGGIVNHTSVNGGNLYVSKGGKVNSTTINNGGQITVLSGGTATRIIENGGFVQIETGAKVSYESHLFSGMTLLSMATIHSGTTATDTNISGGILQVHSSGIANNTTIYGNGSLTVMSGGITDSVKTYAGGELNILRGGILTGKMKFLAGAVFLVEKGAVINFDLTQISAGENAILNDLSLVQGVPDYTLTVNDKQETGIYKLADAAAEFDDTITVNNTKGKSLGTLKVGESIEVGEDTYTLRIDDESLVLSIAETIQPDTTAPTVSNIQANITTLTNQDVVLTADYADDVELAQSLYKLGEAGEWTAYVDGITMKENGTVYFKAIDAAGNESEVVSYTVSNIDKAAPTAPTGLDTVVSGQKVALVWNACVDEGAGLKEYVVTYSLDDQDFTVRTSNTNYVLNNADFGSYSWMVQAVDFAGNESAAADGDAFTVSGFKPYTVEYSADNFEHFITFAVTTPTLNAFRMPGGIYQMRVRQEGSSKWLTGDPIVAPVFEETPQLVKSDADGNADVFFANPVGTWESCYVAQHVGSIDDWAGTDEYASVYGKNKLADIIEGSTDANILLMTDDENGDTLFVDDIYTASPGNMAEQQARIARINEIRAGAGDDIVDMTSQQFEYVGDGLTIRGGAGNDTIWANKGDNRLFGDAGNDRIVGASGNDVIVGGIGNDRMHGGGGNDVFTFCDNWGADNVEQLETGSVTLWFASGSIENWDEAALTYSDGENSVKVSGVTADRITLKFGDDGSEEFAALSAMGAFFDATTERIFEESGKGMLASL